MAEAKRFVRYTDAPMSLDMPSTLAEETGYSYFGQPLRKVQIIFSELAAQEERYGENNIFTDGAYNDLKNRGKLHAVTTSVKEDGTKVHVHAPENLSTETKEDETMAQSIAEIAEEQLKQDYPRWNFVKRAEKDRLRALRIAVLEKQAAVVPAQQSVPVPAEEDEEAAALANLERIRAEKAEKARLALIAEQKAEEERHAEQERLAAAQAMAARGTPLSTGNGSLDMLPLVARNAENSVKADFLMMAVSLGREALLHLLEQRVVEVGYVVPRNVQRLQ